MNTPHRPDVESLIAESSWLRALALRLARDEHQADDLVQRTYLAGLKRPRPEAMPLRGWIVRVVRSLVRQDRRAESRRRDREFDAAASEARSSDDLERLEMQRRLLDAVSALAEPYRATVLARYFEGLPPRSIAERQGVPVKTVKTRLSRGLEQLRAALDGKSRSRDEWVGVVLTLFDRGDPGTPLLPKFGTIRAAGFVLAGLLSVGWVAWTIRGRSRPPTPEIASNVAPAAIPEPLARAEESVQRSSLDASTTPPVSIRGPQVRGRVIDLDGQPVGSLELRFTAGEGIEELAAQGLADIASAKVGACLEDGTFVIDAPNHSGSLHAMGGSWTTIFVPVLWADDAATDVKLFVVPSAPLVGRVLDPEARPIAGATIVVRPTGSARARSQRNLERCDGGLWSARSDGQGRFSIPDAPLTRDAFVRASALGHTSSGHDLALDRSTPCDLVLSPATDRPVLRGVVVGADGKPAGGAFVSQGHTVARADERGSFALEPYVESFESDMITADCKTTTLSHEIHAVKFGFLPGRVAERSAYEGERVEIRLGGPALSISGSVQDADGQAIDGARVWTADLHRFALTASASIGLASFEGVMSGASDRVTPTTASRSDGVFVLGGLLNERYRLVVFDPRSMLTSISDPVPAGSSDVTLTLPRAVSMRAVAGRVLSARGEPLAGVRVLATRSAPRWSDSAAAWTSPTRMVGGATVTSDAGGRFAFGELETEGLSFLVLRRELGPVPFSIEGSFDDLRLVEPIRLNLQVDLRDRQDLVARASVGDHSRHPEPATWFSVLDAEGRKLTLLVLRGHAATMPTQLGIDGELSEVVSVPGSAACVVILKHDPELNAAKEVARAPIPAGSSVGVTVRVP